MVKLESVLESIEDNKRKEVVKLIEDCSRRMDCSTVKWKEFFISKSSEEILKKILTNGRVEFLIPIIKKANEEKNRKVILSFIKNEEDEVWIIKVNGNELYANISISRKTMKYLDK